MNQEQKESIQARLETLYNEDLTAILTHIVQRRPIIRLSVENEGSIPGATNTASTWEEFMYKLMVEDFYVFRNTAIEVIKTEFQRLDEDLTSSISEMIAKRQDSPWKDDSGSYRQFLVDLKEVQPTSNPNVFRSEGDTWREVH